MHCKLQKFFLNKMVEIKLYLFKIFDKSTFFPHYESKIIIKVEQSTCKLHEYIIFYARGLQVVAD